MKNELLEFLKNENIDIHGTLCRIKNCNGLIIQTTGDPETRKKLFKTLNEIRENHYEWYLFTLVHKDSDWSEPRFINETAVVNRFGWFLTLDKMKPVHYSVIDGRNCKYFKVTDGVIENVDFFMDYDDVSLTDFIQHHDFFSKKMNDALKKTA